MITCNRDQFVVIHCSSCFSNLRVLFTMLLSQAPTGVCSKLLNSGEIFSDFEAVNVLDFKMTLNLQLELKRLDRERHILKCNPFDFPRETDHCIRPIKQLKRLTAPQLVWVM
jgi:hypothetical protein